MDQLPMFDTPSVTRGEGARQVADLVAAGALFVVNHSGGKDSQAMYLYLASLVPAGQLVVVHAELGEVEWSGALDHINATVRPGTKVLTCKARRTLLEMVAERGQFPSPAMRQCTSDLKRGPIERTIRQTGAQLIVNCMGMRAQESASRSKLVTFKRSERNCTAGREWFDWLPIHAWTSAQVFQTIKDAGQEPHPMYAAGMSRFSCCFCIMASKADLTLAAQLNPTLYAKYVQLERTIGRTMLMPVKGRAITLEEFTGIKAA